MPGGHPRVRKRLYSWVSLVSPLCGAGIQPASRLQPASSRSAEILGLGSMMPDEDKAEESRAEARGSLWGWLKPNVTYFAGKVGFCVNCGADPLGAPGHGTPSSRSFLEESGTCDHQGAGQGAGGPGGHPRGRPPHQVMPMVGLGKVSDIGLKPAPPCQPAACHEWPKPSGRLKGVGALRAKPGLAAPPKANRPTYDSQILREA